MRERYQDSQSGVDYSFNKDIKKQREFDNAIGQLIIETDFTSFGVGICKWAFQKEFVETRVDPYLPTDVYPLAITLLLERYVDFLAHHESPQLGRVTLESQGPKEDALHQMEYARALVDGSQWVPGAAFRGWLETGLRFAWKGRSHPVELADFFARDLFEWIRSDCTRTGKWWSQFCSKIYVRGDGKMGKFGVKVFPDTSIRDQILRHRLDCGAREEN